MKHTQGKWVAKPNPSDSKKHGIWSQHPTRGTSLIAMAQMDFMTEEELKANAKLIAAVPDLLEVAEKVFELLKHSEYSNEIEVREIAGNAIKKATS